MKQHEHHFNDRGPIRDSERSRAAEEIAAGKEEIKSRWEARVREEVRSAADQSSLALRNTLGTFLDELASELKEEPSKEEGSHEGMSRFHGEQRASFSGYFLPQLLREFSLLRAIINEWLNEKGVLTYEVRSKIDKAIDSVISTAATEFAAVQNAKTDAALLRAETSNLDLERFGAVAAHDLKSPLATITGYLSLLESEFPEKMSEEGRQFIQIMLGASQRMRDLVDSLLDYARLKRTEKPFQRAELNAVVKGALQNLSGEIAEAKAAIVVPDLPAVMGDAGFLTQLFQNLIANAMKFRGGGAPEITISVKDEGDFWEFAMKDNGVGFDPKHAEEIFTLYKKLHGESQYKGSGIGLASSKKVVELHGGRIWAESKPGAGATFRFTLPKIRPGPRSVSLNRRRPISSRSDENARSRKASFLNFAV